MFNLATYGINNFVGNISGFEYVPKRHAQNEPVTIEGNSRLHCLHVRKLHHFSRLEFWTATC